jgi:hypothetical protein
LNQDNIPTATAKPSDQGLNYLLAMALGFVAGSTFELPWQLILYCGPFAAGLWFCVLVVRRSIRMRNWLPGAFVVGLFLIVAGMALGLVGKTL